MELDKPFIMLFSNQKLTTGYLRDFRKKHKKHLQIIIPKNSITFEKLDQDGNCVKTCRFACIFYCYKMNLQYDLTFVAADEDDETYHENASQNIDDDVFDYESIVSELKNDDTKEDSVVNDNVNQEESNNSTLDLYKSCNMKDLKQLCKERNLKVSGNKSVLLKRLVDHDEELYNELEALTISSQQQSQQSQQSLESDEKTIEEIEEEIEAEIKQEEIDEMENDMASVYSDLYTKEELIQLCNIRNIEVNINNTAYEIAEKLLVGY
jgi:hypothetical protein